MFYAIEMEKVPDELIQAVLNHVSRRNLSGTKYLHINPETLNFFMTYSFLSDDIEIIDIEKLKEILLLKHLKG